MDPDDRLDAEEDERLALKALHRGRTLPDVGLELLHRGDGVRVAVASRAWAGVVTYAAGDLLVVDAVAGAVEVRLGSAAVVRVVERVTSGGFERSHGPESFTARLGEHEAGGAEVELVLGSGEGLMGVVSAVARDHVVLAEAGGSTAYVPLAGVAAVATRRP